MKKFLTSIILPALILSSCGNTDTADNSTSSAKATTAEHSSVLQEKEEKSESSDIESLDRESSSELEYFAEIDESVSFDTYEQFSESKNLQECLENRNIDLTQISDPIFDEKKYSLDSVTMYPSCAYYWFTDNLNGNSFAACLEFNELFTSYEEMKQYLDDLYNYNNGGLVMGEFSSDDENEMYVTNGNHLSISMLSQDGLLYSIFSETAADEDIYTYCRDVRL